MAEWVNVDEAVDISGYNPEYIRRLIRTKQIVAEKKGRDWWVDRSSLLVYLKKASSSGDRRRGPKTNISAEP
jgi:hypothetical protein